MADHMIHARIDNDFTNHPPADAETGAALDGVTEWMLDLAHWIADNVPGPREQAQALSALEICSFHCKAGIAREATHPGRMQPTGPQGGALRPGATS